MDGEGTESNPYLIESIEDLVFFAQDVKGGNTYENKYVKLATSLNFKADTSYINPYIENFCGYNGTLKNALTTGDGFHGIGSILQNEECNFHGNFNGNNCIISNLFMNTTQNTESGVGLFSYNYGTIYNIGLNGININATFGANVPGTMFVGGLVGRNEGIISCVFTKGEITSKYTERRNSNIRTGGICGQITSGKIENSYNVAKISTRDNYGTSTTIGGCVGTLSTDAELINCYNIGIIEESNNKKILKGGIVGSNSQLTATVENCYYLDEICLTGIGTHIGSSDDEENLNKTVEYMKSKDFVNLLNPKCFKLRENDYPILYWQE